MLKKQFSQFNHIMQGIEKFYEDYAKLRGLTYMSLTVLEIIYYSTAPCTQKNICEQAHYNKQIVNSIIKGFYENDYLIITEASLDRRNKHITLSEKGKEYADSIIKPLWKTEKQALSVLSEEERISLLDSLEKFYNTLVHEQSVSDTL